MNNSSYFPWVFYQHIFVLCRWAGNPTTGLNPRCNWNVDEGEFPGLSLNLSLQWNGLANDTFFLRADFKDNGDPVRHQFYRSDDLDQVNWESFETEFSLMWEGVGDPGPMLIEDHVEIKVLHYEDLPANFCLV